MLRVMAPKKTNAKVVNFRLSEEARTLLARLAESQGITMTAVLELLIRQDAERKGLRVSPNEPSGRSKTV